MGLEPTNLLTASQALYQLSYTPSGRTTLSGRADPLSSWEPGPSPPGRGVGAILTARDHRVVTSPAAGPHSERPVAPDAGNDEPGPGDDPPRRHDRRRRAAVDPARPAHVGGSTGVGRQRVRP